MNKIYLHIANSTGSLKRISKKIESAYKKAAKDASSMLNASCVDIIAVDDPYSVIPELGVGGYTPSAHIIYLSLDTSKKIKQNDIYLGLMHELHHAMRWRDPGYGNTLKEALLTEGLATLFEEEISGETPIYALSKITQNDIRQARKNLDNELYNHHLWFITGDSNIPRWFGYTYGYKLAKEASERLNKTAAELVHEPINKLMQ